MTPEYKTFFDRNLRMFVRSDIPDLDHSPFRELHKMADFIIEGPYVIKNRYDGIVYPSTRQAGWRERLSILWNGIVRLR